MKNIEKLLNEFSREITDHYTIVVMDSEGRKRFTFKDHRVRALENELKKHYGDKVVKKIIGKVKRAETEGTLKNFAVDDSVDFSIDGDTVKAFFKEDLDELTEDLEWDELPEGELKDKVKEASKFKKHLEERMQHESTEEKKLTKRLINQLESGILKKGKEALGEEYVTEVSAEIALKKGGQLGYAPRKIFDEQGNIIDPDKLGQWKDVMIEVVNAIKAAKLQDKFAPNVGETDVHLGKGKNLVFLTADDGSKYKYNVASKRLEKA